VRSWAWAAVELNGTELPSTSGLTGSENFSEPVRAHGDEHSNYKYFTDIPETKGTRYRKL